MKKFLLVSCALASFNGCFCTETPKTSLSFNELKLSNLTAAKFDGVAKKGLATRKLTSRILLVFFVNNAWDEENEINNSTVDTMFLLMLLMKLAIL